MCYRRTVTRVRYEDPFVPGEFGATYGNYVASYRYQGGLVEVHLFTTPEREWLAFLTKAPNVPMRDAQALADDAFHEESRRTDRVRIVMDPYSAPRSGSV